MKKNLDDNSKTWLADRKLKKILKIDDFKVSELILNFDLLVYGIDGKIRHFYDEDHSELAFEIGSLKFKRKKVDEFIKNYPDLGNSEPGTPASYRWRLENRLKNISFLERIRDQQLLPTSSHLEKEKSRIKEDIKDGESATSGQGPIRRSRSSVAKQIYISAAARAKILIQNLIHSDILPVTRQEKLKILKADKQFQKILASLPKCPSDKHLMRRLHEAERGLWELGKSTNKKYRKKSMYSS